MANKSSDGFFRFERLQAGTYVVSARTADGLFGSRSGLLVREGETVEGVDVVLAPGAKLKLRYEGEGPQAFLEVQLGGTTCAVDRLERSKLSTIVVPAGALDLRWFDRYPTLGRTQQLTLGAGEERELVWDGKP